MKLLPFLLVYLVISAPVIAAEPGHGKSADADSLYQKAEKLEWYTKNKMKEVDGLYEQAARAGSDAAKMMRGYNTLAMADPEAKNFKKRADQICDEMDAVAKKWADTEDADQNFHLARYYILRACKTRNLNKSRELMQKAAEAGNAKAQYYMGRMLLKKDGKAAFDWFSKAAKQEFPQAIANQGVCYLLGLDVEKNQKKGMALIDKALASGNPNACYDIAIWYLQGEAGLPQDLPKAREILTSLAKSGYEPAMLPLEDIKKHEEDLKRAD